MSEAEVLDAQIEMLQAKGLLEGRNLILTTAGEEWRAAARTLTDEDVEISDAIEHTQEVKWILEETE